MWLVGLTAQTLFSRLVPASGTSGASARDIEKRLQPTRQQALSRLPPFGSPLYTVLSTNKLHLTTVTTYCFQH